MPNILITGAAGFIGQQLASVLLSDPSNKLILTDIIKPPIPLQTLHPQNVTSQSADLSNPSSITALLNPISPPSTIYLLHGIMSSVSEGNFALGLSANIHTTLSILEALRTLPLPPNSPKIRLIYASSVAVYGPPFPSTPITEFTLPTPSSSYGSQKFVCETLINDYTRKGFIDGLILRFPTVSVRAGKPTGAASSFFSGIIREPLNGIECVVPIEDREYKNWVCSPRILLRNLVIAGEIKGEILEKRLGTNRRVNLPGSTVSVGEMREVLEKFGGRKASDLVKEERDEAQEDILRSWPSVLDTVTAGELGFVKDDGFEQAVRDYVEGLKG